MRTKLFLLMLFAFDAFVSLAQKREFPFTGTVYAGALNGEQGGSLQTGFTIGMKLKTWTTAVGTGLDYYGVRSFPVYLSVEKKIVNKAQTPFVYVNGGYHFPWLKDADYTWWNETKATGGAYYGAGLGYQAPVSKTIALFFAAGYSFKQFREEMTQRVECFVAPCPEFYEKVNYGFRRLSLTTGLRF